MLPSSGRNIGVSKNNPDSVLSIASTDDLQTAVQAVFPINTNGRRRINFCNKKAEPRRYKSWKEGTILAPPLICNTQKLPIGRALKSVNQCWQSCSASILVELNPASNAPWHSRFVWNRLLRPSEDHWRAMTDKKPSNCPKQGKG